MVNINFLHLNNIYKNGEGQSSEQVRDDEKRHYVYIDLYRLLSTGKDNNHCNRNLSNSTVKIKQCIASNRNL